MRTGLILKLEVIGGTSLTKACEDATELACKLDIVVEFKFNDIKLWATKDRSVSWMINDYDTKCEAKSRIK